EAGAAVGAEPARDFGRGVEFAHPATRHAKTAALEGTPGYRRRACRMAAALTMAIAQETGISRDLVAHGAAKAATGVAPLVHARTLARALFNARACGRGTAGSRCNRLRWGYRA